MAADTGANYLCTIITSTVKSSIIAHRDPEIRSTIPASLPQRVSHDQAQTFGNPWSTCAEEDSCFCWIWSGTSYLDAEPRDPPILVTFVALPLHQNSVHVGAAIWRQRVLARKDAWTDRDCSNSLYLWQGITFKGRDRAAPLDAPLKIKKES